MRNPMRTWLRDSNPPGESKHRRAYADPESGETFRVTVTIRNADQHEDRHWYRVSVTDSDGTMTRHRIGSEEAAPRHAIDLREGIAGAVRAGVSFHRDELERRRIRDSGREPRDNPTGIPFSSPRKVYRPTIHMVGARPRKPATASAYGIVPRKGNPLARGENPQRTALRFPLLIGPLPAAPYGVETPHGPIFRKTQKELAAVLKIIFGRKAELLGPGSGQARLVSEDFQRAGMRRTANPARPVWLDVEHRPVWGRDYESALPWSRNPRRSVRYAMGHVLVFRGYTQPRGDKQLWTCDCGGVSRLLTRDGGQEIDFHQTPQARTQWCPADLKRRGEYWANPRNPRGSGSYVMELRDARGRLLYADEFRFKSEAIKAARLNAREIGLTTMTGRVASVTVWWDNPEMSERWVVLRLPEEPGKNPPLSARERAAVARAARSLGGAR